MITITLMGQLQTTEGERDLACELLAPVTVRQVIQRQGRGLRHMLQLLREKRSWSPSINALPAKIRSSRMGMRCVLWDMTVPAEADWPPRFSESAPTGGTGRKTWAGAFP